MNADADYLIGLAAIQVGLIQPGELFREAPVAMEALLQSRCNGETLAALRARAEMLIGEGTTPLPDLIAALADILGKFNLAEMGATTVQAGGSEEIPCSGAEPAIAFEAAGRYQFAQEYGRGGMGRVLMVYDEFLARRIALKELLRQPEDLQGGSTLDAAAAADPSTSQQRARFLHEARITGQLEHPSIVPVYELGQRENGTLYYTMRFVKGRSLRQAIQGAPTLAERMRLLPHFMDLCQAIAFAHSRGVIHRDIKPGNVMVGEFGETVVIDWGLARAARPTGGDGADGKPQEEIDDRDLANPAALGTPAYMPPEQATGQLDAVNERSDVYSLGAVLYELLAGTAPYPDLTPAKALKKLLAGPPPPVKEVVPDAPEQLMAICRHAMKRNPMARYQSAGELSADIERFLSGRLVGAYNYSLRELFLHFVRSFKAPLAVGAIGLVALSVTASLSYHQIETERDRAVAESHRAQEAEQAALASREVAEQEFYLAAISSARKYIADGRFEKAMDQLDKCPPRFRHWEWGYLLYLCNQDQRTFRAHESESIWSIEVMPDGKYVASSGFDSTARIWDKDTGALLQTYTSPHGAVIRVSPHPSLPVIAFAEQLGYLTLYDFERSEVLHGWRAAESDMNCVQFHPGGELFVTGDDDGYLRLWDFESRTERYGIKAADTGIEALVFSPEGSLYASADRGPVLTVRETETGAIRHQPPAQGGRISGLAFSPDGSLLAASNRDSTVLVWNLASDTEERVLAGHLSGVWAVAFSPDGRRLASASSDLTVRLWSTETWAEERVYRGHQRQVYCLAFSPDGRMLFSGDNAGVMKQWDTVFPWPRTDLWLLPGHTGMVNHVTYSPDGALAATSAGHWISADDKTARLWDANSGALVATLEGHGASVRHTAFHPDEPVYATSSHDHTIRIWDRNTHTTTHVLGPFESGANVVAFSPNEPGLLAAGLRGGQLFFINWRDGSMRGIPREPEREVLNLTYSPDGRWLAVGNAAGVAHILDAETGALVRAVEAHRSRIPAIAFSPDGAWFATGGHDWKIVLWDTETWEQLEVLEGHTEGVYTLQFSEDGRRLLSSGSDGSTILWDMKTFRELLQIEGWVSAMRPGNLDIVSGERGVEVYLLPAFPWEPETYADHPGWPLSRRVEAYKQQFWQSRRP